ncbi:major capsid protein [Solilutibacter silvestris]|uniref:Coat protein n=1 Tax=Solilutibacter silvestris TaxID=1645665 RepID=A0A2K1PYG3_9GAMM|nr:major capsid protein [Lysobacter silvestris]PNS07836.1 hypothetical protein Lysil_2012 [Lysobacter silvestris]
MPTTATRIADVIVPDEFTDYIIQNTAVKSALVESGLCVRNTAIDAELMAGSDQFTIPHWNDLPDDEADIISDDPDVLSQPHKVNAGKQVVRKSFLHNSWSTMNLASELSGSDPRARISTRATAYWTRQLQRRLVASLNGILADNVANASGDMVKDISGGAGAAAVFAAPAVIDAAGTLGDSMRDVVAIAMHSDTYKVALKNDMIQVLQQSDGGFIHVYRGLQVVVDDGLPVSAGVYTTALFGAGAVAYGVSAPRIALGTEIERRWAAGNGGGMDILHSRVNLAVHPSGFAWKGATMAGASPSLAELALPANWGRVFDRKNVKLAFLKHKIA